MLAAALLFGCRRDQSFIAIRLPPEQRLEDTDAGWWLRELGLQHNTQFLLHDIKQALPKKGALVDKYIEDGETLVKLWRVPVTRQRLLTQDTRIYIFEKQSADSYWLEVPFGPEGISWWSLMDRHVQQGLITSQQMDYLMVAKKRPYGYAATIVSPGEHHARLFLFGWGQRCVEVRLGP